MTPKDKVRAMLHKEATDRKEAVRALLTKEAGFGKTVHGAKELGSSLLGGMLGKGKYGKTTKHYGKAMETARAVGKHSRWAAPTAVAISGAKSMTDDPPDELEQEAPAKPAAKPTAKQPGAKPDGEVPTEALAGAGGAVVGGVGGYHAADALGIDKMTGAIGGGALTAIAAAILANKMKATA